MYTNEIAAALRVRLTIAAVETGSLDQAVLATLAGLSMLKILESAFTAAFKGPYAFSALITFVITVAGVPVLNIGAPFWGIVAGAMTSLLLERADFANTRPAG